MHHLNLYSTYKQLSGDPKSPENPGCSSIICFLRLFLREIFGKVSGVICLIKGGKEPFISATVTVWVSVEGQCDSDNVSDSMTLGVTERGRVTVEWWNFDSDLVTVTWWHSEYYCVCQWQCDRDSWWWQCDFLWQLHCESDGGDWHCESEIMTVTEGKGTL